MTNSERAAFLFRNGYNCAQAIFSTFGPLFGLDEDTCLKVACPFGGGMACLGNVCGAVTGSLMVIGLFRGRGIDEDNECKTHSYKIAQSFIDDFTSRFGTIVCRDLIDCDVTRPEEYERTKNEGIFSQKCESYIISSAEILEKILVL